ncbi:calcineurin-like phosphoesterase C-terminal domain-containing protein [Bacteroides thetaiotaomicron]|uniref:calcineurin-like phosphoesterase C-terminal domain-containing protein n=1 Tax=Bacteroides thetaiotaomicron TaxID=818 RepID=UPI002166AC3E|nr:calcineurin-like phosphoesterase C-terminal domain-containing protein [Bacteroides thetaiotaomicron]MCS2621066.1 calcineurin-like phosphoesterase C-terminal domain-containing protein [Bacteroides thetaiotaomicron]
MVLNTAAVRGHLVAADINAFGTPRGYGIYEVNGDHLKWIYKSAGYPLEHQFHALSGRIVRMNILLIS